MDFSTSDKMKDILGRAREIVRDTLVPVEKDILDSPWAEAMPKLTELRKRVKDPGLWAPHMHQDAGGLGLSNLEHGMLSEVLGYSPIGHYCFGCQAPDAGNMEILYKFGTDQQKKRYLEPLVAGEIRSCFSMTEPDNAGSNPTNLSTTAVRDGDHYVINGRKWFTTAADGAAFAVVMAVTNPDQAAHGRASQIIVPTDTPGYRLVRNIPIMGHAGGGWASHAELEYADCRVPVTNLLGQEGAGFAIAQERLGPGRIHHCMRWLGICERAFDMLCQRAATRELREGQPLGSRQIIQSWIAEARAEINAARLMVQKAAWTIDNVGFYEAREQVSLIKFFVADVMMRLVDRAIQTHGALGVTSDTVLSWFYVHERGARIYDGPDEVHKMVVAKRILARYGMKKR
ncbi:MAG: acyl-CoA dehydrogenase family protein [Deltaproteobacteria bacterium]|nr:acyl-CoA dehydrogenase family protein [Deltaproteobacteria bacterium]